MRTSIDKDIAGLLKKRIFSTSGTHLDLEAVAREVREAIITDLKRRVQAMTTLPRRAERALSLSSTATDPVDVSLRHVVVACLEDCARDQ